MEFIKYNKIYNTHDKGFIPRLQRAGFHSPQSIPGKWVVTEKIDGANFAFYSDGTDVKFAKRSGFVVNGENFYNADKVVSKYAESIRKIAAVFRSFDGVENLKNAIDYIIVYGELCGGSYDTSVEERVVGEKAVQKRVLYSPVTEFIAFDIGIVSGGEVVEFLPHWVVQSVCCDADLPVVPALFSGTLKECIEFSSTVYNTDTDVPSMFGLKAPSSKNIREGSVIKFEPEDSTKFYLGNTSDTSRAILKHKNDLFKENNGKKEKKVKLEADPLVGELATELQVFINENRILSILSKIGDTTYVHPKKLAALMAQDIREEELKTGTFCDSYNELDNSDKKNLNNILFALCDNFIQSR